MTKKDLVDKIINMAFTERVFSDSEVMIRRALREGRGFPRRLLPGKLIERLSDEERELLKTLTSEDFNNRVKGYV